MATQDTTQLKEKIISTIRTRGPSLPVHIAKEINMSMLFASAFLSELISEKKIKTSNLRVGSSPLYLIQGQEERLENFSNYLKSKEKDAFVLIRDKSFLKDSKQEPAIRVALRAIKDFAIPFKKQDEIYWRYFKIPENEFVVQEKNETSTENKQEDKREVLKENEDVKKQDEKKLEESKAEEAGQEVQEEIKESGEDDLQIFDEEKKVKKKVFRKKTTKKKASSKVNEKFFNSVKGYLSLKEIEILDIVGFSKDDLILKVKEKGEEKILVAYNKKSLREEDLINAYKKSQEFNLKYLLLSFGEPLKKLNNFIEAALSLERIEKIDK